MCVVLHFKSTYELTSLSLSYCTLSSSGAMNFAMEDAKVTKPYRERLEQGNGEKSDSSNRNSLLLSPVTPMDTCDNSLTCLNWLQSVRIVNFKAVPVIPEQQESFSTSCSDSDESSCSSDGDIYQEITSNASFRKCLDELAQFKKSRKDHLLELSKPGYSYVTLIFLAVTSSNTDMTLHDICKWIKDNFCYYRVTAFGWQNSIRHHLSTNNLFIKVSRVTGKGNYWRINPKYIEFVNGGHAKRRTSQCHKSKKKRCDHSQSQSVPDPCKVPGDLDWISLLGSQKVNCSKCGGLPSHSIGFSPFVSPDLTSYITDTTSSSTFGLNKLFKPTQPDTVFNTDEQTEIPYLVQDSPFILPGADSRPHSPVSLDTKFHPWAESTPEKTKHLGLNWTNYSPYPITTANAAMAQ